MNKREVVVLSGVRTPIGDYGGALKNIAPSILAAKVVQEAVARAQIDPEEVGHLVFGSVIHSAPEEHVFGTRSVYQWRVTPVHFGFDSESHMWQWFAGNLFLPHKISCWMIPM